METFVMPQDRAVKPLKHFVIDPEASRFVGKGSRAELAIFQEPREDRPGYLPSARPIVYNRQIKSAERASYKGSIEASQAPFS